MLVARLVEVEAYPPEDPASHAYSGPTARNRSMFRAGGIAYVYQIYGVHLCLNVVTEEEGIGAAVLLRAAEPLLGLDGVNLSGPARLARALGVARSDDGTPLWQPPFYLARGIPVLDGEVGSAPRVGVARAREKPYRLYLRGSPWVSRPRPSEDPGIP